MTAQRTFLEGIDVPHNGTPTSVAAAKSVAPTASTMRARVLKFIESRSAYGATIDEVSEGTGLLTSSVCGRVSELKRGGMIRDSGRTRQTRSNRAAAVLVAT